MSCSQNFQTKRAERVMESLPVVNPCEGFGYKAPFQKEVPFKLMFVAQWYDEIAEIEKRFLLSYFHFDGTIELKHLDRQKLFLKRRRMENIRLPDLFVGNKLYILGRHMIILDYGDNITKDYCTTLCERALLLVRPEAMDHLPSIIQRLERCFRILFAKIAIPNPTVTSEVANSHELNDLEKLQGQPVAAFFLMAERAVERLKNLVGEDPDPEECLLKNYKSLRAMYGKDKSSNGFYYPETEESILRTASFFFAGCAKCTLPSEVRMDGNTTCCVIKPHILKEGRAGVVLGDIVASGYEIKGLGIFWLNKAQAEEFYEIYERIYAPSEFRDMVDELAIGPCMAVELGLKSEINDYQNLSIVERFRECAGPSDPCLARKVRPCTLRARHGLTTTQNAIHCTELPEDAISELEYFFKLLDRRAFGLKCASGMRRQEPI